MFFIIDIIPMLKCMKVFQGTCDTCHIYGEVKLFKSYQCLRLFFIPILKWGTKYYLQPSCGTSIQVEEEAAIALLHGQLDINTLHLEHAVHQINVCHQCGHSLKEEYDYCPYCGYKR